MLILFANFSFDVCRFSDIQRENNLDHELHASGFNRDHDKELTDVFLFYYFDVFISTHSFVIALLQFMEQESALRKDHVPDEIADGDEEEEEEGEDEGEEEGSNDEDGDHSDEDGSDGLH